MNTEQLRQELVEHTRRIINQVQTFKDLELSALNFKSNEQTWSILEIIEHLNRYARFYNTECKKRIAASNTSPSANFKPGLLGDYFAKSMLPKEKLNPMKTFANMNPNGSDLDQSTIEEFISLQKKLLEIFELSREVNWPKVKTSITISTFIKLKLGDTFRVLVYHNVRHMVQATQTQKLALQALAIA